jgi:L-ascorbate metabolism protein UlaG (beta-lactamase superfamily)
MAGQFSEGFVPRHTRRQFSQPCGFIIQLENGFKIYHMGDTGLFGDMKMIGEYYKPDLILIPIGGGQFVMNPVDAAYATKNFLKIESMRSRSTTLPIHSSRERRRST